MATGTVAEKAIEVAADVAEVVSEESAQVAEATRLLNPREAGFVVGGVGIGVAVGFAGGYFLLKKRLITKYDEIYDQEISAMRENYNQKKLALEGEEKKAKVTVEEITEERGYSDRSAEGGPVPYHKAGEEPDEEVVEVEEVVETEETRNIFKDGDDRVEGDDILDLNPDWDYETELKNRDPHVPYVIHRDEYDEGPHGEKEYEKHTFTYFEGDDVLSDERDNVLEDQDGVVGLGNLTRFGHGSGDPNTVYIRNDQLEVDIELNRSNGKFAQEVMGFDKDELTHSSMRRRIPRRSDYDGET